MEEIKMKNFFVAKSYQDLPIIGEVFTASGKQYINVQLKSGKIKTVRAYSENEYAKLYPSVSKEKIDPYYKSQKELLGFEKGYITAFIGDTYPHKEYLKSQGCKYTRWWGWYVKSTDELPSDLPTDLTPVKLYWEPMAKNDEWLKNDEEIKKYVDSQIYEPTESEYVGEIGERLDLYITIEKIILLDNEFGHSKMYLMRDDCGNAYVWTTASAKNWQTGEEKHIRGTVKAHREYKNDKQTVLSRCSEVKEK